MPNPTNRIETDPEHQRADSEGMAPKKPPTESTPAQREVGAHQAVKQQEPKKESSTKPDAATEQRGK